MSNATEDSPLEVERKYLLTVSEFSAIEEVLLSRRRLEEFSLAVPVRLLIVDHYYDTVNMELYELGGSLRIRQVQGMSLVTLKQRLYSSRGTLVRRECEQEVSVSSILEVLRFCQKMGVVSELRPHEQRAIDPAALLVDAGLARLFTLETDRLEAKVNRSSIHLCTLALDCTRYLVGSGTKRVREMEIEKTQDALERDLDRIAGLVASACRPAVKLCKTTTSKSERGVDLLLH